MTKRRSITHRLSATAATALLATTALLTTGGTAHAERNDSAATLWNNETLTPGDHITNGRARLVMQHDGNLVAYEGDAARWSTGTVGCGSRTVMQTDGNLVVYAPNGRTCWESHTARNQLTVPTWDVMKLKLEGDASLQIITMPYSEAPYFAQVWASK
ncbi:hypothetical protein ACFWAT_15510 [Streptomyces syringium]|uniref:hypothetical protein n=1 Tax=Streptomyces syringium TaxID=76729 RepID=UPI003664F367